jgi:diadenosine tetraphosphate (Ap4A) HIT family hydrolase
MKQESKATNHPKTDNHSLFLEWYEEGSRLVYEGEQVLVFVADICVVPGHLLVVPKEDYVSIFDVPSKVRHELYDVAVMMAKRAMERLDCKGVQIMQNEQMYVLEPEHKYHVSHIHLHVQPRFSPEEIQVQVERRCLTAAEIAEYRSLYR